MIGKNKNTIIASYGDVYLAVYKDEIEQYLSDIKKAVEKNNYRIEHNSNRKDNSDLFLTYVINERQVKKIILSLSVMDFSEKLQNEHKGFEHECLYVFGKDVILLERFGDGKKRVSLYIKFNMLEDCFVIVVSFHEQKYPLKYYFTE